MNFFKDFTLYKNVIFHYQNDNSKFIKLSNYIKIIFTLILYYILIRILTSVDILVIFILSELIYVMDILLYLGFIIIIVFSYKLVINN